MPLVSQTFDQLLDFTRTTAASFVGSNGLIQNTPASVNLLTFTQQFDNAAWAKVGSTVTANSTVAPDGTSTADTADFPTNLARVERVASGLSTASHTLSIYIKGTNGQTVNVELGAVAQTVTLNGDWQRVSVTASGSTSYTVVIIRRNTTATSVFIWGAQLEVGSTATTYTRNNGGVFPPRFDYDPVTLAPKGILIEEQRTNLLLYSEQFDNAGWGKGGATVTANAAVAPDGTSAADKLVEDTANTFHRVFQTPTLTAVAHTITVYAKPAGRDWLYMANASASQAAYFNVSTGVIGTIVGATTATITPSGNGWYRCSLTSTPAAGVQNYSIYTANADGSFFYTGNGTSGIFIWGAQIEAGSFATSYIPTVASQVTRTADQTSIVAPNFAPWYNQSEGTFVAEASTFKPTSVAAANFVFIASDGTQNERVQNVFDTSNTTAGVIDGNVSQANFTTAYTINQTVKCAIAYRANDFAASFNGAAVVTDTSGTIPTVSRLTLGSSWDGLNFFLNGHIRSIRYFPVRLSNTQLQALTA